MALPDLCLYYLIIDHRRPAPRLSASRRTTQGQLGHFSVACPYPSLQFVAAPHGLVGAESDCRVKQKGLLRVRAPLAMPAARTHDCRLPGSVLEEADALPPRARAALRALAGEATPVATD